MKSERGDVNFFKVSLGVGFAILAVLISSPVALARDANDFYFSEFSGKYTLSKTSDGQSIMKIREELVANFPEVGQGNRGIERAIPLRYRGRPIFNGAISVTRNGRPEPIDSSRTTGRGENKLKVFRIGDKKTYLNGQQRYVIEYTVRNVISQDEDYQSLFWNTNGTGWNQPFAVVKANVVLDQSVANDFVGEVMCFFGPYGLKVGCDSFDYDQQGGQISFIQSKVGPRSNLSFALKFKDGSFAKYKEPAEASLIRQIAEKVAFLPLVGLVMAIIFALKKCRPERTNKPIVAQFLPPKNLDVFQSAVIFGKTPTISASIIEMAVSGKVKIVETEVDGFFGKKKKQYELELIDDNNLSAGQKIIHKSLFFGGSKTNYKIDAAGSVASRMGASIGAEIYNQTKETRRSDFYKSKKYHYITAAIAIIFTVVAATIRIIVGAWAQNLLIDINDSVFVAIMIAASIISFMFAMAMLFSNPLSRQGEEIKDYLKGLKLYIKMAEADRLKYTQSVDGAERLMLQDDKQRVKLYEKLLPYAMIFGLEKTWAKVIEVEFGDNYRPEWLIGSDIASFAAFSASMRSFSDTMNSYSYNSGASGGGFGGSGFSGGGGGGGGGGGW